MSKRDLFAPFRDAYRAEEAVHGGPVFWRSLAHKERTQESIDQIEQEFPHGSALPPEWVEKADDPAFAMQRRDMLKLMGASMALAGLGSACIRRPELEVLPYVKQPEEVIPGIPTYYATALPGPNGAAGVLVETHEGRPTKIEGNPDHPASLGRADLTTQSRILELYDPDRSRHPMRMKPQKAAATWEAWDKEVLPEIEKKFEANGGKGLALLMGTSGGPTFERLARKVQKRYPNARLYRYDPMRADNQIVGTEMVFGAGTRVHYSLSRAKVIAAIDSNFLVEGPDHLALAAGFADGRDFEAVPSAKHAHQMNRLYVIEGVFSLTGSNADHRLRVASSEIPGFLKALAYELFVKQGLKLPEPFGADAAATLLPALKTGFSATNEKFIPALAKDLARHRGTAVVLVGERQPAAVHALAHLLNAALGAFDGNAPVARVTRAFPAVEDGAAPVPRDPAAIPAPTPGAPAAAQETPVAPEKPEKPEKAAQAVPAALRLPSHETSIASLTKLVQALEKGAVDTLVILGPNPVYAAPRSLGVEKALAKAKLVVHAGLYADETAQNAHLHLPLSHPIEAWNDAESWDGTLTVCQQVIEPLFDSRSEIELLAQLAGEADWKGRTQVERTWKMVHRISEAEWRHLLHRGATKRAHRQPLLLGENAEVPTAASRVASAISVVKEQSPGDGKLEVVFTFSHTLHDGRFANLSWNQEMPDPMTKLCWDNALVVGPALAKKLGIGGEVVKNRYDADVAKLSVGDASIEIPVFVLPGMAPSTMMVTLGYGRTHAGFVGNDVGIDVYPLLPRDGSMFALGATVDRTGRVAVLASTQDHFSVEGRPIQTLETMSLGGRALFLEASVDEYAKNPTFAQTIDVDKSTLVEKSLLAEQDGKKAPKHPHRPLKLLQLHNVDPKKQPWEYDGQAWGMTIDLTACIGCNACAMACQAENNVPTVGREQVLMGREMHWLRVDRYYTGDVDEPAAAHQPVPCMHCENAPCEPVCPVAATVHDSEGLNAMVYNRCVGTRYCSNNCPYKVRRFNYFDFTHSAHLYVEPVHKERMRTLKMVRNPNVTVRFRGVMEKCTYCTQRIQEAKYEAKRKGMDQNNLPDGAVTPACAQTCPTQAITFGNINGTTPDGKPYKVKERKLSERNYEMLQELNVRPRTTFLAKLRNLNPELA